MTSISTKKGDSGVSSLANGQRKPKYSLEFEVLGDIDELNSWLGVVIAHWGGLDNNLSKFLQEIQKGLYEMSAEVSLAKNVEFDDELLLKIEKQSQELEDEMKKEWHNQFILPGGVPLAAWLDLARAVCRRAERSLCKLQEEAKLNPIMVQTINRLSDYLYLLRCWVNAESSYQEQVAKKKFNT